MALVRIAHLADMTEAQVAASALRASGIPVFLQNECHGGNFFHLQTALGGFGLWVPEEEAFDARAFVAERRSQPSEIELQSRAGLTPLAVGLGLVLGAAAGYFVAAFGRRSERFGDDPGD